MDFKLQFLTDHQIRTEWEVMDPLELLTITDEGWYYAFLSARIEAEAHGCSCVCIRWPDKEVVFLERSYPHQNINIDELVEIHKKSQSRMDTRFTKVAICKT